MDLIHRKEKYKEYLKKIEKAKSDDVDYKFVEALEARSEVILQELREQNDKKEMNLALALIFIPFTLLSAASFIRDGANLLLIPYAMVVLYLIYYRVKMLSAAKMVKEYKIDNRDNVSDKDINWLSKKIEYISYGIEVKLTRLRMAKVFYMIFFPLLLVLLSEFVYGSIPFGNRVLSFFVAFLVGGLWWHYIFNDHIEDLEENQTDMMKKMKLLD